MNPVETREFGRWDTAGVQGARDEYTVGAGRGQPIEVVPGTDTAADVMPAPRRGRGPALEQPEVGPAVGTDATEVEDHQVTGEPLRLAGESGRIPHAVGVAVDRYDRARGPGRGGRRPGLRADHRPDARIAGEPVDVGRTAQTGIEPQLETRHGGADRRDGRAVVPGAADRVQVRHVDPGCAMLEVQSPRQRERLAVGTQRGGQGPVLCASAEPGVDRQAA